MLKKRKKWYILRVVILLFLTENCKTPNEIYTYYPKGGVLSNKILQKAARIVVTPTDIILFVDIADYGKTLVPNVYMLFFDKKLKLYDTYSYEGGSIDSIKNDTIYGVSVQEEEETRFVTQRNLANHFTLYTKLVNYKELSVTDGLSDYIIEEMQIDSSLENVTFKVHSLKEQTGAIELSEKKGGNINSITLKYPIFELAFQPLEKKISVCEINTSKRREYKILIPKSGNMLNTFYDELLLELAKRNAI